MRHFFANGRVTSLTLFHLIVLLAIAAATENYNCPIDCQCDLAQHTHVPLLHARCSSLHGFWETKESRIKTKFPLHSLDLSHLNLSRLAHALDKLPELTSIDLSHNQLHEIGHLGRRIKRLNLKDNRLTSDKLNKLPRHVQRLNLQHNDITYLPLDFKKLHQLQWLELSHNHLNCSCETLEVRNWLMENKVEIQHPVICEKPETVHGQEWTKVDKMKICQLEEYGHHPLHLNEADDSEPMLGDQPLDNFSGAQSDVIDKHKSHEEERTNKEEDADEDEDELKHAFLPITTVHSDLEKSHKFTRSAKKESFELEGSGDDFDYVTDSTSLLESHHLTTEHFLMQKSLKLDENEDEADEGSGSGDDFLIVPSLHKIPIIHDILETFKDNDNNKTTAGEIDGDDLFKGGLGIFEGAGTTESVSSSEILDHQEHLGHVPVPTTDGLSPSNDLDEGVGANAEGIKHNRLEESPEENNATYILLGIVGAFVVALGIYVAIKRCQQKQPRRRRPDAENPQRELIDMDKKHLGKPLRNGVPEHVPLISEKSKPTQIKPMNGTANNHKSAFEEKDVKDGINGAAQKEPLLRDQTKAKDGVLLQPNAIQPAIDGDDSGLQNELSPHEYYPISPRYPTPKSPRASKYIQPLPEMNNNHEPDSRYTPSSPKSGRYSPVYSPETGRVKIKLTEIPRPKTPMLVQRSRSNAGDIISVPLTAVTAGNGHFDEH